MPGWCAISNRRFRSSFSVIWFHPWNRLISIFHSISGRSFETSICSLRWEHGMHAIADQIDKKVMNWCLQMECTDVRFERKRTVASSAFNAIVELKNAWTNRNLFFWCRTQMDKNHFVLFALNCAWENELTLTICSRWKLLENAFINHSTAHAKQMKIYSTNSKQLKNANWPFSSSFRINELSECLWYFFL